MSTDISPNRLTRRQTAKRLAFLGGGALSIAFVNGLAGCASQTANSVTTTTIDGTKVLTDTKAISQALTAALGAPSIAAVLTPAQMSNATEGLTTINATITSLETAIPGGTVSVSVDKSTIQHMVSSLITDVQGVLAIIQNVLVMMKGPTAVSIGNYISAVLTLLPLIELAVGLATLAKVQTKYTEEQALMVCRTPI